jgi:hypothetical protein
MVLSTTKEPAESLMTREMTTGTILTKEGALLPEELQLETNP